MSESIPWETFLSGHEAWSAGDSIALSTLLKEIPCRVNVSRSLSRMGFRRKRIDRLLSRKQTLSQDLYESICAMLQDLEKVVFSEDSEARNRVLEVVEHLYPMGEPAEVHVVLQGPDWLDSEYWIPPNSRVKTRQARWLLQNLDGLMVAGQRLTVTCTPEIRKGKSPPRREADAVRKRRLFSRWFEGIQVDQEGLYSLTPEYLAMQMTKGLEGRVVDGTCGVGALCIAAARQVGVSSVLAVDSNDSRIRMAEHNASIYKQSDRIAFKTSRLEECLTDLKCDWLLLDPPWGGADYDRSLLTMSDLDFPLEEVLGLYTGKIRLKLPRSFKIETLPGTWSCLPAIDPRGVLKFLMLERA